MNHWWRAFVTVAWVVGATNGWAQEEPAAPGTPENTETAAAEPQDDGIESAPIEAAYYALAERLPASTMLYAEIAGTSELPTMLEGSKVWALIQEEELQRFVAPMMNDIRENLTYLFQEAPNGEEISKDLRFGRISFGLLSVDIEEEQVELVAAVELGDRAALIFDSIKQSAMEDEPDLEVIEVAGHSAFRGEEDDFHLTLVHDDSRILLAVGEGVAEALFTPPDQSLRSAPWFEGAQQGLNMSEPLLAILCNIEGSIDDLMELMDEVMDLGFAGDDEMQKVNAGLQRINREAPWTKDVKAVAAGVAVAGDELTDRVYIHAPEDRSALLSGALPMGKTPIQHAEYASAEADLFGSLSMNIQTAMEEAAKEQERALAILKEEGVSEEFIEGFTQGTLDEIVKTIKESTGIDVETEVIPHLGGTLSFYVNFPPTAGLVLPDGGIIFDLKDEAAVKDLLAKIVAKDDEFDEVDFTELEFQDTKLLALNLVNAGIPFVPTVAIKDSKLLVLTSPQTMKSHLRKIGNGEHLASAEQFKSFSQEVPEEALMGFWINTATTFQYAYSFVGVGLSAMQMMGEGINEVIDPSLLPSAATLAQHLTDAYWVYRETDTGMVMEGHSTVGSPLTGLVLTTFTGAGLVGMNLGMKEEIQRDKRSRSEEQMQTLANAALTYRSSVGSGSWPSDLTSMIDRGILTDVDLLVDPADEKPRRVKIGTGERVRVSYSLGQASSLPPNVRSRLPEDCDQIIYTRGAWHSLGSDPCRLVIGLTTSDHRHAILVRESEWQK